MIEYCQTKTKIKRVPKYLDLKELGLRLEMPEKRKNQRRTCLVPVQGKEGGPFTSSATIDLSEGGLGLILKSPLAINQEIPIELDLGDQKEPLLVIGKVQWVKPISGSHNYRVGVAFKKILQGSKSQLSLERANSDAD